MRIEWESGAEIRVTAEKTSAVISANKAGLLSLARQLEAFALGADSCVCYEPWPGDLEEGSVTLEIIKTDCSGRRTGQET